MGGEKWGENLRSNNRRYPGLILGVVFAFSNLQNFFALLMAYIQIIISIIIAPFQLMLSAIRDKIRSVHGFVI